MGTFCSCYSNRFTTVQDIIDYLINENDILNIKLKEVELSLITVDLLHKNTLMQRELSINNIKSMLAELCAYLIRVNKTYTPEQINPLFEEAQNELLESYYKVKKQNFPLNVILNILKTFLFVH